MAFGVFVSDALSYGGLVFQVLALYLLLRGPLSRYFPLFLYLASGIGVSAWIGWAYRTYGPQHATFSTVYWGSGLLMDVVLLYLVTSITLRALEGSPLRAGVVRLLGIVAVIAVLLPFVAFNGPYFGESWSESTSQLLNFGAAVMTFALWTALLLTRQRDRQLLTVAAGLGITVTCAALTLGVRHLASEGSFLRDAGEWVYRIGQLASPAIWCWAFRNSKPAPGVPNGVLHPGA